MKPYNSFCVENLHVGFLGTSGAAPSVANLSVEEKFQMKTYLQLHGLDLSAFDALVKGKFPSRPFLPLTSQIYKGKVTALKEDGVESGAKMVQIQCPTLAFGEGSSGALEAPRERVFVYGHWMGKADLRYVLEEGGKMHVFFI